uniref:Uncharacterized protein n=1 Tax=Rhizophora mucronata TaxID=61149 RepID=A0A2P2NXW7_RHIMU
MVGFLRLYFPSTFCLMVDVTVILFVLINCSQWIYTDFGQR